MLDRTQLLAKIDEVFYLAPGTLTGNERLKELEGWDSMAILTYISLLDAECGVVPAPADIAACRTVDDLVALAAAEQK
jgi:acyl carrier protein